MAETRIFIKKGRARPFWFGNPVVFSGAIERIDGEPKSMAWVDVLDTEGRLIGQGFYNPHSEYRVRILRFSHWQECSNDPVGVIEWSIAKAYAMRKGLGLPSEDTNCYRLINSEGDYLSGLTIDIYKDVAVIYGSALWVHEFKDMLETILKRVVKDVSHIIYTFSKRIALLEGLEYVEKTNVKETDVRENGVRFIVSCGSGQKTGFYLDQRDNRALIRGLARGKRVLDAYCFTGGFAINAALGGAKEVLGIDTSTQAIERAWENAGLAKLKNIRFVEADALKVLENTSGWDMIICDPPGLAKTRDDLEGALQLHKRINKAAISALNPQGILVTCSCSQSVTRDEFIETIRDASFGKNISIVSVSGAPCDHPINPAYPQGEYLKCVICMVR